MENIIGISILTIGFLAFLYFGYRDDFRRNKGEFITIIFGVPITFLGYALGGFIGVTIAIAGIYITKDKTTKIINDFFDLKP